MCSFVLSAHTLWGWPDSHDYGAWFSGRSNHTCKRQEWKMHSTMLAGISLHLTVIPKNFWSFGVDNAALAAFREHRYGDNDRQLIMRSLGKHMAWLVVDWLCQLPLALAEQQKRRIGCEVGHICENNMMLLENFKVCFLHFDMMENSISLPLNLP